MAFVDNRFEERRRAVATELAERRIDKLLITHLVNLRYLTGFSGSNGALLLGAERSVALATDGRYQTQIAQEVPDIEARITRPVAPALLADVDGPQRVGIEADHLSVAEFEALQKACDEQVTLVPVRGLVEKQRRIKDAGEIEQLAEVAELAAAALRGMLADGAVRAGRTEREIAAELEYRMRTAGSERTSFDTIVASGPNSAKPHHGAEDRELVAGDLVTIDFGAHARGYNSDMTRTYAVGEPDDFSREIYEVVQRAQQAGVEAAIVGTPLVDVDAACRDVIEAAGYGEYFVHSTGHGVGMDVHEEPAASRNGEGELEDGMTVTIEPGIYVPGRGGVRIEDTVVVTEKGPRVITDLGRDLLVV